MLRSPSSQKDKNKEPDIISPIRPLFANRLVAINSESTDNFRYSNQQKIISLDVDSAQSSDRGRERNNDSSNIDSSSQRRSYSSSSCSSSSSRSMSRSRSRSRSKNNTGRTNSRSKSPNHGKVPHYFNDLEMDDQPSVPPMPQKQYIEYEFYEFDDEKDDDLEVKPPIIDNMSPADLKKLKTEVL